MTLNEELTFLRQELSKYQWEPRDERLLQEQLLKNLLAKMGYLREHRLDNKNIVDFFHPEKGIVIECKTSAAKYTPLVIYRQLERYAQFKEVTAILLISGKAMALPEMINHKPSAIHLLQTSWL